MGKNIIYTVSAKVCLEKLKENYSKEIERLIVEKKNIPGEEIIEITASDINEASENILVVKRYRKKELYRLIIYFYFMLGIIAALIGIFFDDFRKVFYGSPIRSLYVVVGFLMIFISFAMLQFIKRKDTLLKRRIENEMLERNVEKLEQDLVRVKGELRDRVEWVGNSNRAETARLHATIAFNKGAWETSVIWWARALVLYAKISDEALITVSVESLDKSLQSCDKISGKNKEEIRDSLQFIPQMLFIQRERIEEKLNSILIV